MTGPVRIVVPDRPVNLGPEAQCYSPFEAKGAITATVPSSARRWDPARKCWLIPVWAIANVADSLRADGYVVAITHADGTPWPRTKARPAVATGGPFSWLPAAFGDCDGSDHREALRRALLRVWHPDHGHPPAIADQINEAALSRDRRTTR